MKTLIFDFDGTIADSFEVALEIAYEITGVPRLSAQEMHHLRQIPLMKVVRELHVPLTRLPGLLLRGRQEMRKRIHEIRPFPGVPEVLAELHDEGYRLFVMSSNSEQNVRAFLRATELEGYFDAVYGNASLFNKAASLRKVMRKSHLIAEDCFYVGDEVRDIVAASKVHVDPVAVAWGYQAPSALSKYHPFAIARQPSQLLSILTKVKR
jgi:phosphoglycolate phosphatase